jgi:DNA modification methylase
MVFKMVKLLQGDCLELMQSIPDKSIDMILCDLPLDILIVI